MNKKILIPIVILLVLLAGVGGFFLIKDNINKNNAAENSDSATTEQTGQNISTSGGDQAEYPELSAILSEVESKYSQATFADSATGKSIEYNLFLPDNYDSSRKYPMVVFIADSSLVGRGATASLEQGYGGVIWATASDQAKHESIVLVPTYPSVIIDDNNGYTMTDYIEATKNLIDEISNKYTVDTNRIYATGQSMGCMTMLVLASRYPDLFAAELFVSGQWKIDELTNLKSQKFFYIVAGGDQKASAGQEEVYNMLTSAGVNVTRVKNLDATMSNADFKTEIDKITTKNTNINMFNFTSGTVASGSSSSRGMGSSEHMSSFNYAYRIEAVRDWLFSQSK